MFSQIKSYLGMTFQKVKTLLLIYNVPVLQKLDGVGPVDNRPCTDQLHHFVKFFLKEIYFYLFFL